MNSFVTGVGGAVGDDARPAPHRRFGSRIAAAVRGLLVSDDSEGDQARVQRIGARFLGAGLVGYVLVSVAAIGQTAHLTASWWPALSLALCLGPAAALIIASFRPGIAWLSPLAAVVAIGYLMSVVSWFVAWRGETTPEPTDSAVWIIAFPGMPSMILMLVHPRWAVINLVVATTGVSIAQQLGRFGAVSSDLPVEMLWAMSFTTVFLAVALVAVRTGRTLDATRGSTYRNIASAAANAALEVEKSRLDAIIHDRIIASLLAVRPGVPDERLTAQASSALAEVARVAAGQGSLDSGALSRVEAIRRIRSSIADVTDRAEVEIVADNAATAADYPAEAVRAVVEAMAEALRNVMRHAGPDAACGVIVQVSDDAISMAVVDDGRGFDPDTPPVGRLGIEVSIRKRMAQVGGEARIRSRRGRGTTVQLIWKRP